MKPLISIIIPVYNAGNTIQRCITSLLKQQYKNIQIVIVDDGSSDDSYQVCCKCASLDNRIKLIRQKNSGVGVARNQGIYESDGIYICFVDADDYVSEDFVGNLYLLMIENNAELSICGLYEIRGKDILNKTVGTMELITQQDAMEKLLREDSFKGYVWNKMFKRSIILENHIIFDEDINLWEDVLFVFQYMLHVSRIVFNPEPKYYYIFSEKSLSHQENQIVDVKKLFNAIEAKNKINPQIPINYANVKRQIQIRYVQSALAVIRNIGYTQYKESDIYIKQSIEIIKMYRGKVSKYLSKKEKILVMLCLVAPKMLLKMYNLRINSR